jgi:hypothetical protein
MKDQRLQAVEDVGIDGFPDSGEDLLWFYGEVCGLEPVSGGERRDSTLCFRSGRLYLRISLCDDPQVERIAPRLTLAVPRLEDVKAALDEAKVPYETVSGVDYTDRRIRAFDPCGNRVELKQEWPCAPV